MRRWAAMIGAAALLGGGSAWAQPVRVDTIPSRATLVCDGRVVGVTPTAVDPATVRRCSLSAADHADLAVDLDAIHGVVARFTLSPAAPRCGGLDPDTGLLVPCFVRGAAATSRGPRCGHLDASTGLMVPCFERASRPLPPCTTRLNADRLLVPCYVRPTRPLPRRSPSTVACGRADPATGLVVPCFGVSARPAPRR